MAKTIESTLTSLERMVAKIGKDKEEKPSKTVQALREKLAHLTRQYDMLNRNYKNLERMSSIRHEEYREEEEKFRKMHVKMTEQCKILAARDIALNVFPVLCVEEERREFVVSGARYQHIYVRLMDGTNLGDGKTVPLAWEAVAKAITEGAGKERSSE